MADKTPRLFPVQAGLVTLTVEGISPLITCQWRDEDIEKMVLKQEQAAKQGKAPRQPEREYEEHKYKTRDGKDGMVAAAFKEAMIRAGKSVGWVMNDLRTYFFVIGDILPLKASPPWMRRDSVRINGRTGGIAYRPCWDEWEVDLTIQYNEASISVEQIINLLQAAGFGVGVGSWRPEKKGNFGRFRVKPA